MGVIALILVQRNAIRWGVARRVVWAWFITIPASATMGAGAYYAGAWFL